VAAQPRVQRPSSFAFWVSVLRPPRPEFHLARAGPPSPAILAWRGCLCGNSHRHAARLLCRAHHGEVGGRGVWKLEHREREKTSIYTAALALGLFGVRAASLSHEAMNAYLGRRRGRRGPREAGEPRSRR